MLFMSRSDKITLLSTKKLYLSHVAPASLAKKGKGWFDCLVPNMLLKGNAVERRAIYEHLPSDPCFLQSALLLTELVSHPGLLERLINTKFMKIIDQKASRTGTDCKFRLLYIITLLIKMFKDSVLIFLNFTAYYPYYPYQVILPAQIPFTFSLAIPPSRPPFLADPLAGIQ